MVHNNLTRMTIAVTEGLTHFSDGSLKLAIIFSETNTKHPFKTHKPASRTYERESSK